MADNSFNYSELFAFGDYSAKLQEAMKPLISMSQRLQEMTEPINKMTQNIETIARPLIAVLENYKGLSDSIQASIQAYNEVFKPIREEIANFSKNYGEILAKFADRIRPLSAIRKLEESQFVYWNPLPEYLVDQLLSNKSTDTVLLEFALQDDAELIQHITSECEKHIFLKDNSILFNQAMSAYDVEMYTIAAVGLLSVIDGVLSEATKQYRNTNIPSRGRTLLKKLEDTGSLDETEYAVLTLELTFEATMDSLAAQSDFTQDEPSNLNRHFIIHGHSKKEKTQLDCIKLMNFLYGILLIDKIANESTSLSIDN